MQQKDHEMGLAREEASRVTIENLDLREDNEKTQKKFEERKEEWKRRIETAQKKSKMGSESLSKEPNGSVG